MKEASTEKRFHCSVCQRSFTRNDHLKRHQLKHTGVKPYPCQFCGTPFARSDGLRDHYVDCARRGSAEIPAIGPSGRRRHACELCISMKLRCDGKSPCSSCRRRKVDCTIRGNSPEIGAEESEQSSSAVTDAGDQALDRGSIQFLLNGGAEGWMSSFHFPPHGDRTNNLQDFDQSLTIDGQLASDPGDLMNNPAGSPDFDMLDVSFVDNLFNGPLPFIQQPAFPPAVGDFAHGLTLPLEPVSTEPEMPFVLDLVEAIASCSQRALGQENEKAQEEILANLTFLLTSAKIPKFLDMYFKLWHPNCRIIHAASFDPAAVRKPLLAAVIFMGALYSHDEYESYAAKTVLDFVELFCFSCSTFSKEEEIVRAFTGSARNMDEQNEKNVFEDLQGCFTMVVIQYWAGNRAAKARAVNSRLTEIVKIARRVGLPRSQQLPEDRTTEQAWIYKESKIRLMHYIILVDCAYSFFQNYPCRLIHAELECDFPCEEHIFDSPHPYSEPDFQFSQGTKVDEAFIRLFKEPSDKSAMNSQHARPRTNSIAMDLKLTYLDMFVLIHLLYAHINSYMNLTALLRLRSSHSVERDPAVTSMKRALAAWRTLFADLRANTSSQEWAAMGFWKNGYNYWLVTQLLISKKDKLDVVMKMEIAEDKLEKLKLLLQDED